MSLFNKKFRLIILFIVLAELISLTGFIFPAIGVAAFFGLLIITLALSLYRLEYGLWIVLAELFIGSMGQLFHFSSGGLFVSGRIALWLVVLSVWLARAIINTIRERRINIAFTKSEFFPHYLVLFAFILIGALRGYLAGHGLSNWFFDLNGWLYFLIAFPAYEVFFGHDTSKDPESGKNHLKTLAVLFTAAAVWLGAKTFILLYFFSHNFFSIITELYRWVRDSGVGEITLVQGGFYRVFFQSHIFAIAVFFLFIFLVLIHSNGSGPKSLKNLGFDRRFITLFFMLAFFAAVNAITFSRSNWVGLAAGLGLIALWLILEKQWRRLALLSGISLGALVIGVALIMFTVKFPWPDPLGGFRTADLLAERAAKFSGEAGASSRWALWPELLAAVKTAPLLGQGFGATVTYVSSDPRVLSESPTGEYTTYAFEWGWLDTALKIGLFGLAAYLALISKIIYAGLKKINSLSGPNWDNIAAAPFIQALLFGLAALSVINFFSPYFNHPLGIGYLIITALAVEKLYEKNISKS